MQVKMTTIIWEKKQKFEFETEKRNRWDSSYWSGRGENKVQQSRKEIEAKIRVNKIREKYLEELDGNVHK